ncbi:hypothetical protein [Streptomyces sp. NPDC088726]|uniref:hypothetical protein n=1 Tax=Streptomyces sp. NPDC088726 TaxID=3365874 RepID=UPI00382408E6
MDQVPGERADRHEHLRTWGIREATGERLIEIFAALAAHAVAVDALILAEGLGTLPLETVAAAATSKRDFELLAGLPATFDDVRDDQGIALFRLSAYAGGQASRQLFQLSREVRHALTVLAESSPMQPPICEDVFRRAADSGLR